MGFLKYLLLLVVKVILALVITLLLTLILSALSTVDFIAKITEIVLFFLGVFKSNAIDVSGLVIGGGSYALCFTLAEKLNAHKPFLAVCVTGMVFAVICGAVNIIYGQPFYVNIVALFVSVVAFAGAKKSYTHTD